MKKLSTDEFIIRATKIHGNAYDYSCVVYVKAKSKVKIICKNHGEFLQEAFSHLSGKGCRKCWGEQASTLFSQPGKTLSQFEDEANAVHMFQYDYSDVVYINCYTKIKIKCSTHGIFEQIPNSHLQGSGCPKCFLDNSKMLEKEFILHCNITHGWYYGYDKVNYVNNRTKIEIVCPKHGSFFQTPYYHLNEEGGCPHCSNHVSKMETSWLDSLDIFHLERQKSMKIDGSIMKVDAFDPKTNTIYEFYGDFWHGNPKVYRQDDINIRNGISFGELFAKTMLKEQKIRNARYNLVSMWESDFQA